MIILAPFKPSYETRFTRPFSHPVLFPTTIAGSPKVFGFSGAGGPAASTVIGDPFNVAVDNGGNIFFTGPDHNRIWKINTAAPVATPVNNTTCQVIVSTDMNCTASGKVAISVFKTLKMADDFTPNGDGKNDVFRIPPALAVKLNAFAVYDRWGMRVFYTSNNAAGWDGRFGGQPKPLGTYVWIIEYKNLLTGKPTQARGTVILIR